MAQAAEQEEVTGSVEAAVKYIVNTGEKPATYLASPGDAPADRVARYEMRDVTIRDGRPLRERFALERTGFVLTDEATAVTDFYDDDEVRRVYYPEVEALVKAHTGASRVLVFDHTIRTNEERTRTEKKVREPVYVAHNDYTEKSAPQRVRDLLPANEAEDLLKHRYAVVQVWRPIRGPVRETPLAICDAQSIAPEDLIETDLVYKDRTGEILQLAFNPTHRWFYFPNMERSEALIFKCYDSATDGRARFTAHTAFADPTSAPDAPQRESIEMRTLAFFDDA